ncbi:30S ribosomal protein S9 [Chitinispirillales bacterium ANBcel5]|uniref:30S ribosomal protein S9 n=1 Tax=Cellulosispirillum alkaliphilum TaxID=3039283 RepID=UPI002A589B60|nr:30S ribosomal protein S9 [Chitinispirillales bacterium ANBcel5]
MENRFSAVGKRKNAIASVIIRPGKGEMKVNGMPIKEYLKSDVLVMDVEQPLAMLQAADSYDIIARVKGGGLSGQSGALRLGISRALALVSEDNRKQLRKSGFLTRDSRVVERKKYGLAGARRRFQFSKR